MLKGANCHQESGRPHDCRHTRPSHSQQISQTYVLQCTHRSPERKGTRNEWAQTHEMDPIHTSLQDSRLFFFRIYPHVGPSRIKHNDTLR